MAAKTRSSQKLLTASVLLAIYLSGCSTHPRYDGSQWPWNPTNEQLFAQLKSMGNAAANGNNIALHDLFNLQPLFDTERAEFYSDVLLTVYEKRGNSAFCAVLVNEPLWIRVGVLQGFQEDVSDKELQEMASLSDVTAKELNN